MGYRGGWARANVPTLEVPLKPPVDPEHLAPHPDVDVPPNAFALWSSTVSSPALDGQVLGDDPYQLPVPGGPVDQTPEDHSFGMAGGNGVTQLQAQQLRAAAQAAGGVYGAYEAHAWEPMVVRDGDPRLAVIPDTAGDGDSPATVELRNRTGVGVASDGGNSRLASRQKRWYDRFIDMHRYPVVFRPMYLRNAKGTPSVPAIAERNQLASPFPRNVFSGTRDSFVAPQERRTPVPWDQPITHDGADLAEAALPSWGL